MCVSRTQGARRRENSELQKVPAVQRSNSGDKRANYNILRTRTAQASDSFTLRSDSV